MKRPTCGLRPAFRTRMEAPSPIRILAAQQPKTHALDELRFPMSPDLVSRGLASRARIPGIHGPLSSHDRSERRRFIYVFHGRIALTFLNSQLVDQPV